MNWRTFQPRWVWAIVLWLCTLLIALVAGHAASLFLVEQPIVLQIPIKGDIDADLAERVSDQLSAALDDDAVAGIVLRIDSPGGDPAASERLYTEILRARERKPVVAMVDGMAASGAYFIVAAAERIYAASLSDVGNVGVWSVARRDPLPSEDLLVSGPHKLSGVSEEGQYRQLELIRQRFLQAVLSQRAGPLGPNAQLLPRGEMYLGVDALKLGLIDEIGTLQDANDYAARRAGVRNQRIRTAPDDEELFPPEEVEEQATGGGR